MIPCGHSKKLHCSWSGPFRVLKKLSEVTYRILHCQSGRKRIAVHFNRLKRCPINLCDRLQLSQHNSLDQGDDVSHLEGTKNRRTELEVLTQCHGEGAFIPDVDEVAEIEESVISEQSSAEETAASKETLVIAGPIYY